MDRKEIETKLAYMLLELFPDSGVDADIIKYVDLVDDLGMDSITFVSIIIEIESTFDITVPDDMLVMDYFKSFEAILDSIEKITSGSDADNVEVKQL